MAITLTVETLNDMQGRDHLVYTGRAQEFLDAATAMILRYCPIAPDAIHNRACRMLIDYFDEVVHIRMRGDTQGSKSTFWNARMTAAALRESGAMAILGPFKIRRALS